MIVYVDPSSRIKVIQVKIPINTTLSDPINLRGFVPKAILTPGTLQSTSFQFTAGVDSPPATQGREDTVVYKSVVDDAGAAITVTVSADKYILLPQAKQVQFLGLQYVKLLMNQTETAERNFFLICAAALQ
jgi:hypothetical protein